MYTSLGVVSADEGIQGLCGTVGGGEESTASAAQQRMRTDDKTPQRPQATVVRGTAGEGEGANRTNSTIVTSFCHHYRNTLVYDTRVSLFPHDL